MQKSRGVELLPLRFPAAGNSPRQKFFVKRGATNQPAERRSAGTCERDQRRVREVSDDGPLFRLNFPTTFRSC